MNLPIKHPRTASLLGEDFLIGSVIYTDVDLVVPGLFLVDLLDSNGFSPVMFTTDDVAESFARMGKTLPTENLKVEESDGTIHDMTIEQYLLSFSNDRLEIPEGGLPPYPALHFVGEIKKVAPLFVKDQALLEVIENGLEMHGEEVSGN